MTEEEAGIMKHLSKKIVNMRGERRWSQDALSERIKVGGRFISRYENRKSIPNATTIKRMAQAFGTTTDYLLFDEIEHRSIKDRELFERFLRVDNLSDKERNFIKLLLDVLTSDKPMTEVLRD